MQLDPGWVAQQGEDAPLLWAVANAFTPHTPPKIAVAVSGGGDSMALLHVCHRLGAQAGIPVEAVTVDHGLRAEAKAEAQMVAQTCQSWGIPHTVLTWDGWDGQGNLQHAARTARYNLIAAWAKNQDIGHIVLGHTCDDVAETFLMRLSRKSGLEGLAAMEPQFTRHGLRWARPLWQQSRATLRDYLRRHDVAWVEDPSNADTQFARVRARQVLDALAPLGIDTDGLMHSAYALLIANKAVETALSTAATSHVTEDRGNLLIALKPPLAEEIRRRMLNRALQYVGGGAYPPRWSALAELDAALGRSGKHTLAGCLVTREPTHLHICREFNAVRTRVCATDALWDGRWQLTGPHAPDLEIRALGESVKECPDWRETGLPRRSLLASPAVWKGETLIAAPLAGYNRDWSAKTVASFTTYLLSH